jgi:hypothetical protein
VSLELTDNNGSFSKVFGESKITQDEESQLHEICMKIRAISLIDITQRGLNMAHNIITGGVALPAKLLTAIEKESYIYAELNRITKNPPRSRMYLNKLEKVYSILRV